MSHADYCQRVPTPASARRFSRQALAGALDGFYWKPIQAGLDDETNSQTVLRLSGLAAERVLPEAYRLRTPASPHLAAELDGVTIEHQALHIPEKDRPLVVEGAGGLMVPLTRNVTYLDLLARWRVAGGALRPHGARHHQPQSVVDRGAARAGCCDTWRRLHRRGERRNRTDYHSRWARCDVSAVCRMSRH